MKTGRNPQANDAMVKKEKPYRNIFLYPIKSESLPNISTHVAIISTYEVMTQLTELVERLNVFAIVGRAMVTIVASKAAMKFASAMEVIRRAYPFLGVFRRVESIPERM